MHCGSDAIGMTGQFLSTLGHKAKEPWLESSGRRHGAGCPHHAEAERFGRLVMPLLQNRA
jgi:hypothetical protein